MCVLCDNGLGKAVSKKNPHHLMIFEELEDHRINVVGVIESPNPNSVRLFKVYRQEYQGVLMEFVEFLRQTIQEAENTIKHVQATLQFNAEMGALRKSLLAGS